MADAVMDFSQEGDIRMGSQITDRPEKTPTPTGDRPYEHTIKTLKDEPSLELPVKTPTGAEHPTENTQKTLTIIPPPTAAVEPVKEN